MVKPDKQLIDQARWRMYEHTCLDCRHIWYDVKFESTCPKCQSNNCNTIYID